MKNMLFIALLAVGVLLFGCVGQNGLLSTTPDVKPAENNTVSNSNGSVNTASNDPVSCLAKYGMSGVVFIHADWCPHCQNMKPLVQQLQSEGYKVVMANTADKPALDQVKECLSGVAQMKYIPEFVCPANKEDHVGEFANIEEMRAFFERCK
jgi:thiol-disulfide isomerase/thioredoxin